MKRPLYKIGDEVIFTSTTHPQWNGEYIIQDVLELGETISHNGDLYCTPPVRFNDYDIGLPEQNGMNVLAEECELKRKCKPSTQSYREIMNDLKTFSIS